MFTTTRPHIGLIEGPSLDRNNFVQYDVAGYRACGLYDAVSSAHSFQKLERPGGSNSICSCQNCQESGALLGRKSAGFLVALSPKLYTRGGAQNIGVYRMRALEWCSMCQGLSPIILSRREVQATHCDIMRIRQQRSAEQHCQLDLRPSSTLDAPPECHGMMPYG